MGSTQTYILEADLTKFGFKLVIACVLAISIIVTNQSPNDNGAVTLTLGDARQIPDWKKKINSDKVHVCCEYKYVRFNIRSGFGIPLIIFLTS